MNYLTVDLYKEFKCIADACPNTCCAGWHIAIDESTYKKMADHEEQLGIPAKDWLLKTDHGICAKLENQRCLMLNHNNLCKVVLTLGPEYLSNTCQTYPRKLHQYGSVIEGYLSMSCPAVIDKLMNNELIQFDFTEDELPSPEYAHTKLYLYESSVRSGIVDILQCFPQITLRTRLFASYKIMEKAIQSYQNGQLDYHTLSPDVDLYFQEIPDYEVAKTKFIYIAAEFCLIQTIALASFVNNDKKLDRNEYIYIISGINRMFDHNANFRQHLTDKLIENNTIRTAGLLLMVLI